MKWILPAEKTDDLVAYLLEQRAIDDKKSFVNPNINQLHDPFLLHDIQTAIQAIYDAVQSNKKIFIHGDFDVDGVTATTIMWRFLYRELGADVLPYIPSRFNEGYGLSKESLDAIVQKGGELVITVDCGVKDVDLIHEYSDRLTFIITDHHTLLSADEINERSYLKSVGDHAVSADALAVVHPRLEDYPFHELCGAGVAWKVCAALNQKYEYGVDMVSYLDLAAFGTVCDIMPLIDENRTIVALGLEQMKKSRHQGINALATIAGVQKSDIDEYTLGYQFGPRINAAGRLEHALKAVKLLSTDNHQTASELAQYLHEINIKRQDLTEEYIIQAEKQIPTQKGDLVYYVQGDEWPEGVVGLIAGRLSQKYSRPVLVGSHKDGLVKGSARSLPVFDIAMMFKKLDEYLEAHGGHVQAAGFTVSQKQRDIFVSKLKSLAEEYITSDELVNYLMIDAIVTTSTINNELVKELETLAPFGMGNPKPVIAIENAQIRLKRTFGRDASHVELQIVQDNTTLSVVAFGKSEVLASKSRGDDISIAGSLYINTFNNIASLKLIDFK